MAPRREPGRGSALGGDRARGRGQLVDRPGCGPGAGLRELNPLALIPVAGVGHGVPNGTGPGSIMDPGPVACVDSVGRSEEHTSELQSLVRISYAVFCLKKKNRNSTTNKKRV